MAVQCTRSYLVSHGVTPSESSCGVEEYFQDEIFAGDYHGYVVRQSMATAMVISY